MHTNKMKRVCNRIKEYGPSVDAASVRIGVRARRGMVLSASNEISLIIKMVANNSIRLSIQMARRRCLRNEIHSVSCGDNLHQSISKLSASLYAFVGRASAHRQRAALLSGNAMMLMAYSEREARVSGDLSACCIFICAIIIIAHHRKINLRRIIAHL